MNTENVTVADVDDEEQFGDYQCQDCERRWNISDLEEVTHLTQRVGPGEVMPAGQCPECGALCHGIPNAGERPLAPRPVGAPPWGEP